MPRTTKRTQKPEAPQEQGYGVRGQQIAAQRAMPLPDNHSGGSLLPAETPMPSSPPAGAPSGGDPSQAARPVTDPAQLLQMLQEQAPPPAGGLARPSERPEETISTGMGQPDLATPPAGRNRAAEALEQIFAVTGDARFEELANRARSI